MNKKAFFHIEILLALLIGIMTIVISTKILYNIHNSDYYRNLEQLNCEALISKIEYDLKFVESSSIILTSESIEFTSGVTRYRYSLINEVLTQELGPYMNSRMITWMTNIKHLSFEQTENRIEVVIIDGKGNHFKGHIILLLI